MTPLFVKWVVTNLAFVSLLISLGLATLEFDDDFFISPSTAAQNIEAFALPGNKMSNSGRVGQSKTRPVPSPNKGFKFAQRLKKGIGSQLNSSCLGRRSYNSRLENWVRHLPHPWGKPSNANAHAHYAVFTAPPFYSVVFTERQERFTRQFIHSFILNFPRRCNSS